MNSFNDIVRLYASTQKLLTNGIISLNSDLIEIVAKAAGSSLAYADDRKTLLGRYGFDFWMNENDVSLKDQLKYASSQQFPDFLMKTALVDNQLVNGSVLELKDSKGGSIASFNSTIPTKTKSLDDIDVINQTDLVSKIASCKDSDLSVWDSYHSFQRDCFYMVRTHRGSDKVKMSFVHGSFFETIPKETLFYQMFLNALHRNLYKKNIQLPPEVMKNVENALSHMTDQTVIASSQEIEKASVRPRLRIMTEVHSEGNPHGSSYDIPERTFNLVLPEYLLSVELKDKILGLSRNIVQIEIHHKRNGTHFVFSFNVGS